MFDVHVHGCVVCRVCSLPCVLYRIVLELVMDDRIHLCLGPELNPSRRLTVEYIHVYSVGLCDDLHSL